MTRKMELYVIRHARAAEADFYGEDGDRPLTPEGRQHASDLGQAMLRHGVRFDRVIASPYVRAVETAELILVGLQFQGGLQIARHLVPDSTALNILNGVIEPNRDCQRLAIVGHEPVLGGLLSFLLQRKNIRPSKGAVVAMTLGDSKPERAELRWVMTPHQLEPVASLDVL